MNDKLIEAKAMGHTFPESFRVGDPLETLTEYRHSLRELELGRHEMKLQEDKYVEDVASKYKLYAMLAQVGSNLMFSGSATANGPNDANPSYGFKDLPTKIDAWIRQPHIQGMLREKFASNPELHQMSSEYELPRAMIEFLLGSFIEPSDKQRMISVARAQQLTSHSLVTGVTDETNSLDYGSDVSDDEITDNVIQGDDVYAKTERAHRRDIRRAERAARQNESAAGARPGGGNETVGSGGRPPSGVLPVPRVGGTTTSGGISANRSVPATSDFVMALPPSSSLLSTSTPSSPLPVTTRVEPTRPSVPRPSDRDPSVPSSPAPPVPLVRPPHTPAPPKQVARVVLPSSPAPPPPSHSTLVPHASRRPNGPAEPKTLWPPEPEEGTDDHGDS